MTFQSSSQCSQPTYTRSKIQETDNPDISRVLYALETPKIKFCPECNNMLYPRENKTEKCLVYFCRACLYQKKVNKEQSCTYVNKITHEINELALIPPEMTEDPTLARTKSHPCPKCNHCEAVFMQGLLKQSDEAMKLYYVCTNTKCRFKWTE